MAASPALSQSQSSHQQAFEQVSEQAFQQGFQQGFQQASREVLRAKTFETVKTRFAATEICTGHKHTARHAVDALTDSDKALPLPPADPNNIGWVLIDHPFPPCTTGLDDLLSVMLKDLVMGSHHRGKF